MEEQIPQVPTADAIDGQVSNDISQMLGALTGRPAEPQSIQVRTDVPDQPAPQVPDQPAPQVPDQPQFTTSPTSAETLKTMFRRKPVEPTGQQPVDVPPDTPIQEPEHMDEKGRNAWAVSRAREKQLRQAIAQLQKEKEAYAAKETKFQTEHDELAKALKEKDDALRGANEKLGKLDLSGSVEFRKRFDEPVAQAEANLDAAIHDIVSGADTPEQIAQVRGVILGDDRQFQDYIAELNVDEQARLIEKRRTYKELSAQRAQAIENWEQTARGLTDQAARINAAEQAMTRQRNAEGAIRFTTTEMPPNLRPYVMTDEAFADEVKNANDAFTGFMQTATEEDMAQAAYLGHFVPGMNRALMMALGECRALQEELARMRGIRNIQTRVSAPPPPPPPAAPKPRTAQELEDAVSADIGQTLAPLLGGR